MTTLPGLYLVSYIILSPLDLCGIYYLRLINLAFHSVNILLFYKILSHNNPRTYWKNVFSAYNITLLPPLYFFSYLYYTDILSVTTVLLMIYLSIRENHFLASIVGCWSVLMRQTNIVWVMFLLIRLVVVETYLLSLEHSSRRITRTRFAIVEKDIIRLLRIFYYHKWIIFTKSSLAFLLNLFCYVSLVVAFIIFVITNGGIVVGDKTAHEATIHIPQLFYFALFAGFFSWSHLLDEVVPFANFCRKHFLFVVFTGMIMAYIIHINTLEHPYLLADNRHYIFYVWKRLYGADGFRYAIIPFYIFGLYCIFKTFVEHDDVSYLIAFVPCLIIALVPQKLIEFRYFLIPFVLYRLNRRSPSFAVLCMEFVQYVTINTITIHLFLHLEIDWDNYEEKQRLIW